MSPSLLIPLVVSIALMFGVYRWYRSNMAALRTDGETRSVPGARLTSERLRELASPPWRVVYEVGEKHLGAIDHVVIGPSGPIAIETVLGDRTRPDAALAADPRAMAEPAGRRSDDYDLTSSVGGPCQLLAKCYWGAERPELAPGLDVTTGLVWVEGQRLAEWLLALPPGELSAAQVDLVWQRVLTGIGRPDPL